jgi:hypothetical protein
MYGASGSSGGRYTHPRLSFFPFFLCGKIPQNAVPFLQPKKIHIHQIFPPDSKITRICPYLTKSLNSPDSDDLTGKVWQKLM